MPVTFHPGVADMMTGDSLLSINMTEPTVDEMKYKTTVVGTVELVLLGTLVICILGGNILVVSAFATAGRQMKTITNYFVVSLAMSDILVGVFSVPCWIWLQIKQHRLASAPHLIYVAFDIMCGVASIGNLTVISLERLSAVIRPATHRNLSRKTSIIKVAITIVWIFALGNACLYYVKVFNGWIDYNIYIVMIGFVGPTLVIVVSSIFIYRVAKQHVGEQQRLRREMRLAKMIALIIVLFLACWLPFFLLNILFTYCQYPTCDVEIMQRAIPLVKFLHYSNSMMNPLVYAYKNSDYREAFKKLIFGVLAPKTYKVRSRTFSTRSFQTLRSDVDEFSLAGQDISSREVPHSKPVRTDKSRTVCSQRVQLKVRTPVTSSETEMNEDIAVESASRTSLTLLPKTD